MHFMVLHLEFFHTSVILFLSKLLHKHVNGNVYRSKACFRFYSVTVQCGEGTPLSQYHGSLKETGL